MPMTAEEREALLGRVRQYLKDSEQARTDPGHSYGIALDDFFKVALLVIETGSLVERVGALEAQHACSIDYEDPDRLGEVRDAHDG